MKKISILLLIFFFISCENPLKEKEELYNIRYSVIGTASTVSITIENEDSGISQFSNVRLPWIYNFSKKKPKDTFVYISAQNDGNSGNVTVRIYKNNKIFKQSSSSGAYVIATASGTI